MDKKYMKSLSETDIRSKFITPAIIHAGWDLMTQIRYHKRSHNCKRKSLQEGKAVTGGLRPAISG